MVLRDYVISKKDYAEVQILETDIIETHHQYLEEKYVLQYAK